MVHQVWSDKCRTIEVPSSSYGDTFYIDEVFVKITGKHQYLWRAVDQEGEIVDVFLQSRRDGAAAKLFFKRLLRRHGGEPGESVTGKLRSHGVAQCEFIPETLPNPSQYANTRAELSHQPTRGREGVTRHSVARALGLKVTWPAEFCGVTVTVAGGRWTVPAGRLRGGRGHPACQRYGASGNAHLHATWRVQRQSACHANPGAVSAPLVRGR